MANLKPGDSTVRQMTLLKKTTEEVKVNVTFPIFRKHDVSGDTDDTVILTRIDLDLSAVHLTRKESHIRNTMEYEIEFEKEYRFDESAMNYHLGRGKHVCTSDEFYYLLGEIKDRLSAIGE